MNFQTTSSINYAKTDVSVLQNTKDFVHFIMIKL